MPNKGKYVAFPLEKNKILVRIQNIGDKFDKKATIISLNIKQFAYDFYFEANY